jgi:putative ABC transport system ATP-binding protein
MTRRDPHDPSESSVDEPVLVVRGLSRAFAEPGGAMRAVLDGVDLELRSGASAALLGRSGSGKSTLLHAIAGIDEVDAGSIRVCGREVTTLDEAGRTRLRREDLGLVFQFFHLFPMLSVLDNVLLPLDLCGGADARGRERARALLERVGLADRAASSPEVLSGGEQQRVAIARALVHRPRLLLADEPTGNLDAEAGARVLELLEEAVRDDGCALLMVTHSREAAARTDHTFRMVDGRVAPVDTPVSGGASAAEAAH